MEKMGGKPKRKITKFQII